MICSMIDSLIVVRPIELPMLDVDLRYYIDGPHDGSGRRFTFPSSTFTHYYRLRFENNDPNRELVLPGSTHLLSVFFVPFSDKSSVCLVCIESMIAFEKVYWNRKYTHVNRLLRG